MTFHRKKCGIEPQFQCMICLKKFTSKYGLQVHSLNTCGKNYKTNEFAIRNLYQTKPDGTSSC